MFVKLYSRITESSLMEQPIEVRYTFMMLLAIADPSGRVVGTDIAIARRINLPLLDFVKSVKILQDPDPDSNSKEEEGRRVIASDSERGYQLVNYSKYRNLKDENEKREYMRTYMRNRREAEKAVKSVNVCKDPLDDVTQAEAEAEVEAEEEVCMGHTNTPPKQKPKYKPFIPPTIAEVEAYCRERNNEIDASKFVDFYSAKGWMIGKNKIKDWKACVRTWERNEQSKVKEPESPIKQSVLSKFECDHGTYDPTGRIPFQYNTRLCRDLNCPACKPKREAAQ